MARSLLSTTTLNLRTLLANGKRYRVPPFQRDYSWSKEHWEDLWDDVCEALDRRRQHYMGALVLQEQSVDQFIVIDGQQRLATLSLMVVAALRCFRELEELGHEVPQTQERKRLLRDSFLGSQDPVSLRTASKLELNAANRRFYEGTLLTLADPLSVPALPPAERLLWDAVRFFTERLHQRFVVARDGAGLAGFVYEVLGTQLLFIQVTVEDEAGAYVVFETLNARGLELTAGDLLKNYLFSLVYPTGDGNLRHAMQTWSLIAERVPPRQLPVFLRQYLSSYLPRVRGDRVYRQLRDEVSQAGQVFPLLVRLADLALVNEALDDDRHPFWDDAPAAREPVKLLGLFGATQYRTLIFALFQRRGTERIAEVLALCATLTFRYTVIGERSTNLLETVFNEAAHAVGANDATSLADMRACLAAAYPADDEFRADFARRSIPSGTRRTRLIRYILTRLEQQMHGVDYDWESDTATIEHILPQNPAEPWPGFGDRHAQYVNRLGNYLLLEPRLNRREAANCSFAEKLPVYAQSQYPTTRDFAESAWTATALDRRQAQMARVATAVWRWP